MRKKVMLDKVERLMVDKVERHKKLYNKEQADRIRKYMAAKIVEARRTAEDIKQLKEERSKDVT